MMNAAYDCRVKLLRFCILLLLLVHVSVACVSLLNACLYPFECCDYPQVVCRAGACFSPTMSLEKNYNKLLEKFVDESNQEDRIRKMLRREFEDDILADMKKNNSTA